MPADQQTREKKKKRRKRKGQRERIFNRGRVEESKRSLHEAPVMKTPLVAIVVDVKLSEKEMKGVCLVGLGWILS